MRVLLAGGGTGGHLMPALALAQALREARPEVEPVLVGALRGIEAAVLPHHPFRFHLVPIEPIHRRAWWLNLRWPLVAWRSWRAAGAINYAVAAALERRTLSDVNVLWGTGAAHQPALASYAVPGRVVVQGFFDPMAAAYRAADLVVCRAGAMTIAELCAWGKPSVLVPLPSAAAAHQEFNARALAAAGAAVLLPEEQLGAQRLAQLVRELVGDQPRLASLATRARERGHPDAAQEIVSRILTLVV